MSAATVSCQVALDLPDQRVTVTGSPDGHVTMEMLRDDQLVSLSLGEGDLERFADLLNELLEWMAAQTYRAAKPSEVAS